MGHPQIGRHPLYITVGGKFHHLCVLLDFLLSLKSNSWKAQPNLSGPNTSVIIDCYYD